MCRYAFLQEQYISPFLFDCPSIMLGIAICYIQHSQAMHGVCELAHSFFHYKIGRGFFFVSAKLHQEHKTLDPFKKDMKNKNNEQ